MGIWTTRLRSPTLPTHFLRGSLILSTYPAFPCALGMAGPLLQNTSKAWVLTLLYPQTTGPGPRTQEVPPAGYLKEVLMDSIKT